MFQAVKMDNKNRGDDIKRQQIKTLVATLQGSDRRIMEVLIYNLANPRRALLPAVLPEVK